MQLDMVCVPAGEFIYQKDERLTIPAFELDRHPVTNFGHALSNIIGPLFERGLIDDSLANRRAKGTHRTLDR